MPSGWNTASIQTPSDWPTSRMEPSGCGYLCCEVRTAASTWVATSAALQDSG